MESYVAIQRKNNTAPKRCFIHNPYFILFSLIFITGIFIYWKFIFGDYVLVYGGWASDTMQSYLPAYEYYSNKLAEGRFSIYDFTFGYGTNTLNNTWALLDPFAGIPILISLFSGAETIGIMLVYFQWLKSLIIGLLGFSYLKEFGYSSKVSIICAYILSYSGYVFVLDAYRIANCEPVSEGLPQVGRKFARRYETYEC